MHHKTTDAIYSYFNRIRTGRPAPLRAEIEPSALKTALPDVFMLEMGRGGLPVFRLAGTRICAILGHELRGESFLDLWHAPNRHKIKLAVEAVLANQAPLGIDVSTFADEEQDGRLEMLLMPLFSRPGVCDRIFGSLVDLGAPPLLGERNRILRADSLHFIVPDAPSARMVSGEQAAPAPAVASHASTSAGRVLHLRVLDGGRKD